MPELITSHKVDDTDRGGLMIEALNDKGPGGAENNYFISAPDWVETNGFFQSLIFQDGPPAEVGINGLTMESLLAVLIHRLDGFQAGPFACRENYEARKHLAQALECLHARTRERIHRGVEGQLEQ